MNSQGIPQSKIPQKQVEMVKKWAEWNMNLLMDLKEKKITGKQFKAQMKTMEEIEVLLKSETDKK